MNNSHRAVTPAVLSSVLIGLTAGMALLLWADFPDFYRDIVQEDGPIEWMTFWAFAAAGGLALLAVMRQPFRERPFRSAYFLAFGLGCVAVALEEISWGQRLFGYQPPETFLAENFQQEFNLHNLADTTTRKALLLCLLVGFGVLFPLLGRVPFSARWLERLSVPVPSIALVPGFAALIYLYLAYPMESTGEWVELGAGIGFLFAALSYPAQMSLPGWLAAGALPLVLGVLTPYLVLSSPDPERIAAAESETRALASDLRDRRLRSRCGVHKRVYTFVQEYGAGNLNKGAWGSLAPPGENDATRRRYFLDPWNLPYWIRHVCRDGRTSSVFVYSFGPNRRRDSGREAVRPDDIGSYAAGPPVDRF